MWKWTDAGKGLAVSSTADYVDSINAFLSPDYESKILDQTKKSPQRKFLGLKLPTHILHF